VFHLIILDTLFIYGLKEKLISFYSLNY